MKYRNISVVDELSSLAFLLVHAAFSEIVGRENWEPGTRDRQPGTIYWCPSGCRNPLILLPDWLIPYRIPNEFYLIFLGGLSCKHGGGDRETGGSGNASRGHRCKDRPPSIWISSIEHVLIIFISLPQGRLRQSGASTAHAVPATVSVPQGGSKSAPITPPTSKYQDQDSFSQVISATTAFLDVAERIGGEVGGLCLQGIVVGLLPAVTAPCPPDRDMTNTVSDHPSPHPLPFSSKLRFSWLRVQWQLVSRASGKFSLHSRCAVLPVAPRSCSSSLHR